MYNFETFPQDPIAVKKYTLANGLEVFLSKNTLEPVIDTRIVVRAGHTFDPADNTGLAHYLEHMLFKGTSKISSLDWEKEKILLEKISDLYEKHKFEQDLEQKKAIYQQIDILSLEAAQYTHPGEYDQMVGMIGAQHTNAHTSLEETVYKNLIPSNELEKWLMIEKERFSELVLRLFHTELETVYEEFNMLQDRDESKEWKAILQGLFPKHPYGSQTTIGEGIHLKNPSMKAIHHFFSTYYVPNNMAIFLSGDLEYEPTLTLIEKYFGHFEKKPLDLPCFSIGENNQSPIVKTVLGPQTERITLAYRLPEAGNRALIVAEMFYQLLSCSAGYLESELNQPQKLQYASSHYMSLREGSFFLLQGFPKAQQSLDEVKDLILDLIEKIKKGFFDQELLHAIAVNCKLTFFQELKTNKKRVNELTHCFVQNRSWADRLSDVEQLFTVTALELMAFVEQYFDNNYVLVYKKQAEDPSVYKVEKPLITPIVVGEKNSGFLENFKNLPASRDLKPIFADFSTIQKEVISPQLTLINNPDFHPLSQDIFTLTYLFEMGQLADLEMALAFFYAGFLGTEKYNYADLKVLLFKKSLNLSFYETPDYVYMVLSGVKTALEEGIILFEEIIQSLKVDEIAYQNAVEYILQERENDKKNKEVIFNHLLHWSVYREQGPLMHLLSQEELEKINPQHLVNRLKGLWAYPHMIVYRGNDYPNAKKIILKQHALASPVLELPADKVFKQLEGTGQVFFVPYEMVQVSIGFVARASLLEKNLIPFAEMFDTYFGSGLSSVVFQQIREVQSLAYRAYATYSIPSKKDHYTTIFAFIGTQNEKMQQAILSMQQLFENLPYKKIAFEQAQTNILKSIAAQRIQPEDLFWYQQKLKKKGITEDIRKEIYQKIQEMSWGNFEKTFKNEINIKKMNILLMGDKKSVDLQMFQGKQVEELTLDQLFKN